MDPAESLFCRHLCGYTRGSCQVHRAGTQCARSRLPFSASRLTPLQSHKGLGPAWEAASYLYKLGGEKSLQRRWKSRSLSPQLYYDLYTAINRDGIGGCRMGFWRTMRVLVVRPSLVEFHSGRIGVSLLSVTRKASSSLNQENQDFLLPSLSPLSASSFTASYSQWTTTWTGLHFFIPC